MAAPIGPYTPVVRAGDWIIVSGQLGLRDGSLVAGGVKAQTEQAIVNLRAHLDSVGASLSDVAKTLCFLTDMDTFPTFNEAYVAGFGSHRPARSTIGVAALPANGAVEIEAWAYVPVSAPRAPKTTPVKKLPTKKPSSKKK
jgi:2-iminobutanoate/2-iminopropanoate deaminase